MNTKLPILAIVAPCFNEEEIIHKTARTLITLINDLISHKKIDPASFVFFVDDGSRDKTWEIINQLNSEHKNIRGLKLSRNFGHQNALFAGLMAVKDQADCSISIDADLQQDEQAIPLFLEKFQAGAHVVFGIRNNRAADSGFKKYTALFFYKLMTMMGVNILKNHADYRLLSKKALHALSHYKETNLFLRGIVTELGFKTDTVFFDVKEREAGESKYSLGKMLSFAFNGITSFSTVPLRFVALLGFVIFILSLLTSLFILLSKLFGGTVPGWTSTVLPIYLLGGIQVMSIGIVGEYLGKNYQEIKARPRYIIDSELDPS